MESYLELYFDESNDLLENADDCLVRLEKKFELKNINELFRIAHTIKGASFLAGFEDIGKLTHRIEDMLDAMRKGLLSKDYHASVVDLAFEGFDAVKNLLKVNKDDEESSEKEELRKKALTVQDKISEIIDEHKTSKITLETLDTCSSVNSEKDFYKSFRLQQVGNGKDDNMFIIYITFEKDTPLVAPIALMLYKNLEHIGKIIYTNLNPELKDPDKIEENFDYEFILHSTFRQEEIYNYIDLMYVESSKVIDITRAVSEKFDFKFSNQILDYFNLFFDGFKKLGVILFNGEMELDNAKQQFKKAYENIREVLDKLGPNEFIENMNTEMVVFYNLAELMLDGVMKDEKYKVILEIRYIDIIKRFYAMVKGKAIYKTVKVSKGWIMKHMGDYIDKMDRWKTKHLFIDISEMNELDESELQKILDIKRELKGSNIELSIINSNGSHKRILNILDAVYDLEPIELFDSEIDALLGRKYLMDAFKKLNGGLNHE